MPLKFKRNYSVRDTDKNTYTVNSTETEFIVAAFEELGVEKYEVIRRNGQTVIRGYMSNRTFKKAKRIAWVLRLSKETGVRHVCRDEIGMNISGVIPAEEEYFFKKSEL